MEALDIVKLHNLYAHFSSILESAYPLLRSHFNGDNQDEDSFFDFDFTETAKSSDEKILTQPNVLLSQSDFISKRKILPIELSSKPESPDPVSILKSAPRISISLFKKSKSKADETDPSLKSQSAESKRFAFNLSRVSSFRNRNRIDESERQSKRFCGEVVRKYLKLIKPLYVKVSRKPSSRSAPESSSIRVVCRRLGKSKSSSSATGIAVSPTNRRDDSLLQEDDGIESAILHCKRSFSATRDDVDGTCEDNLIGTGDLQEEKAGNVAFSEQH